MGNIMDFNAEKVKNDVVEWIREWFEKNGKGANGVIALSGGKDSSVCAALLVEALGKDKVFGVMIPNGNMKDIGIATELAETLGIRYFVIDIKDAFDSILKNIEGEGIELTPQTTTNLPPRLRMSTVYAVSQCLNGRVCNTCNLSEDYVGYSTRYGDSVGDFSPLSNLTVQEVKAIGRALGLPSKFVDKVPSDGLQPKTDEENLGFTYAVLDKYIRTGVCEDEETKALIDKKHEANLFKLRLMDAFPYEA